MSVRELLKERNTQSGSPWNTFTDDELNALRAQLPGHNLPHPLAAAAAKVEAASRHSGPSAGASGVGAGQVNILDANWAKKPGETSVEQHIREKAEPGASGVGAGQVNILDANWAKKPGETSVEQQIHVREKAEPQLASSSSTTADVPTDPRKFRELVAKGEFVSPTNAVCPGHLQCNLVVLPQGKESFDFLLFCQRNKKACPLIEVCDVGSSHPHHVAQDADLKTDLPKYCIYRNGELVEEVTDATPYWPENSVAFLIGCSFSYDGELMNAGIPLRSAEQGKNVPMYRSKIKCRSAGSLKGHMVVSMKPINACQVAKEVLITNKYPHAHGDPVCVGCPEAIGIYDLSKPDWGDAVEMQAGEVPVFHACGVTPQSVLMDSKVPFAITHSAGYMFVTDLPSDEVP